MTAKLSNGCVLADPIHFRNYRPFWDLIGCGGVHEVPYRKNDITSSGEAGECHSNVLHLVRTYGGKQVSGYIVELSKGGEIE